MAKPSPDLRDGGVSRLLAIMARLRDPDRGCPWDREQDFSTIAPHTIEEAYEVAEAIRENDMAALRDELGDLLFQVVYHAQMAHERGAFAFADVVAAICDKMVRRHPHVFGNAAVADATAQTRAWEEHKENERAAKATESEAPVGLLDGVALALPALARAAKLQKRAARAGFDWPAATPVMDKIAEELDEVREALSGDREGLADEIGDLLFSVVNLARHLGVDAETALRAANAKFERRFRRIEARLAESGRTPAGTDLAGLDALWDEVKAEEGR